MIWTTPAFEQVKMDAEIGSYNEDTDPPPEERFADDSGINAAA